MVRDITLIITDRNGKTNRVLAPTDMTMCTSFQCYINSKHNVNEMQDGEGAMLAEAFNVKENSQLSCQIPITEALNNLEIELAPEF